MKRILSSEVFIVVSLSLLILALNGFVWVNRAINTPKGSEFVPFHGDPDQYAMYTSIIRQGTEGSRRVFDRYVTTPQSGSFVYGLYLIVGWIGGMIGITNVNGLYHVTRYIFGALWLSAILWLCDAMIKEKWVRIAAFFFAVFGAGISFFEAIERSTFAPHITLGYIAIVSTLASIFYYENSGSRKWLYRGAASSLVTALVYPFGFLLISLIVPCYVLLVRRKHWVIGSLVILISGVVGMYLTHATSSVYPWNSLPYVFVHLKGFTPLAYVFIFGFPLTLASIGVMSRYKKPVSLLDRREVWLLLLWIFAIMILLRERSLIVRILGPYSITGSDYIWGTIFVPIGILVAWGIESLWRRVGIGTCIMLILISMMSLQLSPLAPKYMYPHSGYIQALRTIANVTSSGQNVLSFIGGGRMIPMYANRGSYTGGPQFAPDWTAHRSEAEAFYRGSLDRCGAYTFLQKNNIGAILYGAEERAMGDSVTFYPFLQSWNTYGGVTVYTVVESKPIGCM